MTRIERSATRVKGFDNAEMDFQLLRMLGMTSYGGASIGECLSLTTRIKNGDTDDWTREYAALAQRLKDKAYSALAKGHTVTPKKVY